MTGIAEHLLVEALKLPPSERAELADRILSSVDSLDEKSIESLWAEEAESRIDAHEKGMIPSIPADQVFDGLLNQP